MFLRQPITVTHEDETFTVRLLSDGDIPMLGIDLSDLKRWSPASTTAVISTIRKQAPDLIRYIKIVSAYNRFGHPAQDSYAIDVTDELFSDADLHYVVNHPLVSAEIQERTQWILDYRTDRRRLQEHKKRERHERQQAARELRQANAITPGLRRTILERDAYRCRYCGDYKHLGIDHVIPITRGGNSASGNLVACCRACNSAKGARTPQEAGMKLRAISLP